MERNAPTTVLMGKVENRNTCQLSSFKLVLFTEVTLYQSMFFDAGTFRITQERKHSSIVVYSISRFVAH